ncbi:MAG: dephospho-CoA kinase [Actinomycetales bacterium]|nr:dephospho-CoA kinase [Actinomycetales bacterium]
MLLIALTGGIGAGKSSAGSLLARLGAIHISADQLAREVLERGEEGFNQVVAEFGDEILTNGAIDRGKLAEIIFNDSSKRDVLEEITHPLIAQRFLRIKNSLPENAVVVYEIPLLAEKPERVRDFDFIVTIETSQELRLERLQGRGLTRDQAIGRMAHQTSDKNRREISHHVIENNGDLEALLAALEEWWDDFIAPRIVD